MSNEETFCLKTPDGRELHARRAGPADAAIAWVVVHGLGEHSGCYQDLMQRMSKQDHGVLLYDQHGHGHSPGRRGDAPSLDLMVDDISVALECAAKHFSSANLVLLGHSMGGNLVLNHLLDRDVEYVDRAVVTNPMTGSDDELCDRETTIQFVQKAGPMCNHIDFDGLRHSLLLAENRQQVYDEINAWLETGTAFAST